MMSMKFNSPGRKTAVLAVFSFLAMLLAVPAASASGGVKIDEPWTNVTTLPNADWESLSQNGTIFPEIDTVFGNGAPSVRYDGGPGQAALVNHKTFRAHYSHGMTIELDAWLASGGSHYTDVWFGLSQQSVIPTVNDNLPLVQMTFNKGGANDRNIIMGIYSSDPAHKEQYQIGGVYVSDSWNRGRIVIRPDGYVEFWVQQYGMSTYDYLWTTTKTIDPAYDGIASFYAQGLGNSGANLSFVDNVLVIEHTDQFVNETWDGVTSLPNADWEVLAQNGVNFPYIEQGPGNPPPCVAFDGGPQQAGLAYHKSFRANYRARGLVIELDAWLASGGSHYTDVWFGLSQQSVIPTVNDNLPLVQMTFNKGGSNDRNIIMGIYSSDPAHKEEYQDGGLYVSDNWNRGRIVIRPDGYVEFYVQQHGMSTYDYLWTTTKTIDPSFDGEASFYVQGLGDGGSAMSYVDNILIEPGTGPLFDARCNGQDDYVVVTYGTPVELSIHVDSESHVGLPCDLWVVARNTNAGAMWSYGYYGSAGWASGLKNVYYSGGLFDLYETVYNGPLPVGDYAFYFGADLRMNGRLDFANILDIDVVLFSVQ